jgi:hypothetical protein
MSFKLIQLPDGSAVVRNLITGIDVVTISAADVIALNATAVTMTRESIAALGNSAATAAPLTKQVSAVTASNGTKAVSLPAAAETQAPLLVINTVTTATLPVYPLDGGNDNINGGAEDAAWTLGPGQAGWFVPVSATQWWVMPATSLTATTAELQYLDIATLGTGAASKAVVLDSGEDYTWPATGVLTYGVLKDPAGTTLGATVAEINMAADVSAKNVVITEAREVAAAESGMTFFIDNATGFASTLPAPALGLRYTFINKTANTSGNHTIVTTSSANIIKGQGSSAQATAFDTGTADDTINFVANSSVAGDMVELWSDGTSWFAHARATLTASITFTQAST